MHKTIFISDLHLSKYTPELNKLFFKFTDYCLTQAKLNTLDSIYILGDFFNYWIGNDCLEPWHDEIIQAFTQLSQITKIYFLVGNRDFQVNNETANLFKFKLIHEDVKKINIYNQDLLILHGDTLCTDDKKYQKFRKIVRAKLTKTIYLALPLAIRTKIAEGIKKQSKRNYNMYLNNPDIFDAKETEVLKLFEKYNSHIMIHGHTHKPKIHQDRNNNQSRYVLGDWHKQGAYYLELNYNPDNQQPEFDFKFFNA